MSREVEQLRFEGMRKRGPKPKPEAERLARQVAVRLDAEQLERLERLAAVKDLSWAEVLRAGLLTMELSIKNPGAVARVVVDDAVEVQRVVTGPGRKPKLARS